MRHPTILLCLLCLAATTQPATQPRIRPYAIAPTAPLNPTEKPIAKPPTYSHIRVEFNGIEKDSRVPANLYIPINNRPRHPAVLLQYGSGGNKNTNYIVFLGQQFANAGFVVLTIDIPNKGDRKNPNAPKSLIPLQTNFLQTLGDYSRATDYLLTRPDVDPNRLAYVGISWGAITGIVYVAHDPRIKLMASIVGGGNFTGWFNGNLPPETRAAAQATDPIYHIAQIAPRPLLLLNVTKDQLIPRFFSDSLHNAAPPNAKKIWLDTDHLFSTIDRQDLGRTVIGFVTDNLPYQ
ncbi:MAG: dienelactone hydrolase family protein [Planctomycetota bacterium]|nr:dienelactone hydrolase family protein [Planctomycetota bacterium]